MKIYVIAHKEFVLPSMPNIYQVLQVGAENKPIIDEKWRRDNEGNDNISIKNANYNEMTGCYWVWKNCEEDIVGICHYRRFFVSPIGKILNVLFGKQCCFIGENQVRKWLSRYDVVLHNKTYFKTSNEEQYGETLPHPEDLLLMREVVSDLCPDYLETMNQVLRGNKAHLLNVIIAKKETYDAYCTWVFSILDEIERRLLDRGETDFSRRMAMLAERMLDVWIIKNKISYKECFMINTERKDVKILS